MKLQELAIQTRYATRAELKKLAANLVLAMPDYRFEVESKSVPYIRVKGAEKPAILQYFQSLGLDPIPLEPEQSSLSGTYKSNILSYSTTADAIDKIEPGKYHDIEPEKQASTEVLYTLVVAGVGGNSGTITVGKKELTPVSLGLAVKTYNRQELITATKQALEDKIKNRPDLTAILTQLLDIAADGGTGTITPELNAKLGDAARNQIGVDFGEILAPLMFAKDKERIEFPAEGNYPLIDVIVGKNRYSVKSLTGSGTSFASISDLMDSYEDKLKNTNTEDSAKVEKLFQLFKGYHPRAGGKNVDKIIRGSKFVKTAEYVKLTEILGGDFSDWTELKNLVAAMIADLEKKVGKNNLHELYSSFLKQVYPAMLAGGWNKPAGLPADGAYYMGLKDQSPEAKTAGFPTFRQNPVNSATDILTYVLGVGTLNLVTRGSDAEQYAEMMTNIVNQSPAHLGRLDITAAGGIVAATKPFSDLRFKFQYHAPSHLPGNNLPGFMMIYG
jgi:hypothetical protein